MYIYVLLTQFNKMAPDESFVHTLVQQYRENTLKLDDFVRALSGLEGEVCGWGSCQYAAAFAMFRTLSRLKQAGLDPTETIGWGKLTDLTSNNVPITEVIDQIIRAITIEIYDDTKYYGYDLDETGLINVGSLHGNNTLDQAFNILRDRKWDLWSASSYIGQLVFNTSLVIDASPDTRLHVLVQSNNYMTALKCYLLTEIGYIHNPNTAFIDFST